MCACVNIGIGAQELLSPAGPLARTAPWAQHLGCAQPKAKPCSDCQAKPHPTRAKQMDSSNMEKKTEQQITAQVRQSKDELEEEGPPTSKGADLPEPRPAWPRQL